MAPSSLPNKRLTPWSHSSF